MGYDIVVFGATGAIGQALCQWHLDRGCRVIGVARKPMAAQNPAMEWIAWDGEPSASVFSGLEVDAAIWAQGANANDSIRSFGVDVHLSMYQANVVYILNSLQQLLLADALSARARLVIISSIWQNIARTNKLSYSVTKSALLGLVQSLALDLGAEGKLVNAVLPGALDTPMTRQNLSPEQIAKLESMTPLRTLPALSDVCNLAGFLCSPQNTGVTGQFIAADRGFSYAKII